MKIKGSIKGQGRPIFTVLVGLRNDCLMPVGNLRRLFGELLSPKIALREVWLCHKHLTVPSPKFAKWSRQPSIRKPVFLRHNLLKKYGQDAELLYLRGTACAHRDVAEQAENDLRAAIALKPERVDFYITLSNFLFGQKRYESAFHEFIRARKLAPKHPKILAYAKIFGGVDGKLDKQLDQTMKAFQEKRVDRALADEVGRIVFY